MGDALCTVWTLTSAWLKPNGEDIEWVFQLSAVQNKIMRERGAKALKDLGHLNKSLNSDRKFVRTTISNKWCKIV